jgi:magnesium transporter
VAGLYGMNFDHMPELHWTLGYPMAIALMAGTAALMYAIFKKKGWL